MRLLSFLLLLFPLFTQAQNDPVDGGAFCRAGKIQSFGRLAANPKARLAYPGDASIDITYYGLDLRLTHTPNYLRGAATISLKSTVSNLSRFFLDLTSTTATTGEGLRVDSVKAGSQRLPYQFGQNRLTITLPQPLSTGQALTLTVFYQGIPNGRDLGSFRFSLHERTADPVIWSLSEPYGSPDWFPCRDTPADKADSSSVRITADKRFVSVSNGTLERTTDNADGTRTYEWRNHYPIAQYLISIAMTNYERYDTPFSYNGQTMPVTHYIYPEILPSVRNNLNLTPSMLQLFTNRFGPYPFLREKYGHAQIGQNTGGMEHQTISSMEAGALSPIVIAHELAHQWFGDKITCRDWQNIWLNEGFASYAEAVYAESVNGQAGYQSTMNSFMNRARNAAGSIYVQDVTNFNNIFDGNRSYAKGATVLHMLRGVVGDSTFFRVLRTYAATPALAYGTATTDDFRAVAEQVSGQKLDYFFQQWIYGERYPTYRLTVAGPGSGKGVAVRIEQRNTTASSPTSFTMPIQMRVQSAAGDTLVTVFNDRPDQTFTLPARGPVTAVQLDPNNRILKALETTSVVTALNEVPTLSLWVYPNPVSDALDVQLTTSQTGPLTLKLTNAAGQAVFQQTDSTVPAGKIVRRLPLHGLAPGRYVLTVATAASRQSEVVLIR